MTRRHPEREPVGPDLEVNDRGGWGLVRAGCHKPGACWLISMFHEEGEPLERCPDCSARVRLGPRSPGSPYLEPGELGDDEDDTGIRFHPGSAEASGGAPLLIPSPEAGGLRVFRVDTGALIDLGVVDLLGEVKITEIKIAGVPLGPRRQQALWQRASDGGTVERLDSSQRITGGPRSSWGTVLGLDGRPVWGHHGAG